MESSSKSDTGGFTSTRVYDFQQAMLQYKESGKKSACRPQRQAASTSFIEREPRWDRDAERPKRPLTGFLQFARDLHSLGGVLG